MDLTTKRRYVDRFFAKTGRSYDRVVRLCTYGVDHLWKRRILGCLASPRTVLDLACGTGILTLAIARRFPACRIIGVDTTAGYLEMAEQKAAREGISNVRFVHGWAEDFHSDVPFDAITSSYLAKYADLPLLVRKTAAMLSPGGILLFHDFTYPRNRLLASAWELHFKILRAVGSRGFPEWQSVFEELPGLVRRTQWVDELTEVLRQVSLGPIVVEPLTLQGATLVTARKPRADGSFPSISS